MENNIEVLAVCISEKKGTEKIGASREMHMRENGIDRSVYWHLKK